ncbi:hypothetical protein V500_01963, partial [Pseudogymnoascus sp. VKM F-4518 (FW-2643)]
MQQQRSELRLNKGPMTVVRQGNWPESRSFEPDASFVLVGSRGSGKRSLGFIGATKLGRRFLTEDRYFKAVTGLSRGEFLRRHGSGSFCRQNVEILRAMLFDNRKGCVIECGMGSLAGDAQSLLREYSKTNPVIYVVRNLKSISCLLKLDQREAERLEMADLTHRSCSNLEYYNLYDFTCEESNDISPESDRRSPTYSFKLRNVKQDFSAFLDFVTGRCFTQPGFESPFSIAATPAELRQYTYAVSVRLSEFLSDSLNLDELESDSGADVIELSVDVQPPKILKAIAKLLALIRRKMQVPIILVIDRKVRSSLSETSYFELLQYGLRLCLEYIAVDIDSPLENIQQLISAKGHTKVIGDYVDERQDCLTAWSDGSMLTQYLKAESLGCDLVRLSRRAVRGEDSESLQAFREMMKSLPKDGNRPPLIAYTSGATNQASLIFNPTFTPVTPVTRSDLGALIKRDPEYLTAQEAMQALFWTKTLDPLHFYLVGASVFYSLSPAMHNAAYRIYGMSHDYSIRQSSSLDELHQLTKENAFGGAAISQPFKVEIISQLRAISKHASTIGAVNTILPIRALSDGSIPDNSPASLRHQANQRGKAGPVVGWYGDNTDWIGVINCLQKNLSPRNAVTRKSTGLVIGAGGMARAAIYAMIQLGCRKLYVFNRTLQNAQRVADHFNALATVLLDGTVEPLVEVLRSLNDPWPSSRNPPTMVIAAIPGHNIRDGQAINFAMPKQWLTSASGGVVIELAYRPLVTPLIKQIQQLRDAGQPWVIVDGLEVFPEQGILQFELMTGKRAPRGIMRLEVLKRYQEDGWT